MDTNVRFRIQSTVAVLDRVLWGHTRQQLYPAHLLHPYKKLTCYNYTTILYQQLAHW